MTLGISACTVPSVEDTDVHVAYAKVSVDNGLVLSCGTQTYHEASGQQQDRIVELSFHGSCFFETLFDEFDGTNI